MNMYMTIETMYVFMCYHQSSVQHQEVGSLSDISGMNQVMVGVLVFAVAILQSFNKLHESLHRDLKTPLQVSCL